MPLAVAPWMILISIWLTISNKQCKRLHKSVHSKTDFNRPHVLNASADSSIKLPVVGYSGSNTRAVLTACSTLQHDTETCKERWTRLKKYSDVPFLFVAVNA